MADPSGLPHASNVGQAVNSESQPVAAGANISVPTFRIETSNTTRQPNGSYYQSYFNYAPTQHWKNGWSSSSPPWASTSSASPAHQMPYHHNSYQLMLQGQPRHPPATQSPTANSTKPPTPPPPPPEFYKQWDAVLKSFLEKVGLTNTVSGFEADMLVMNDDWERSQVPAALKTLVNDLSNLGQPPILNDSPRSAAPRKRTLDERKLDYVHLSNNSEPRSQTSINKSISTFIAQNRARNEASNREEFLSSLSTKRRRLAEESNAEDRMDTETSASIPPTDVDAEIPSCARTDAKPLRRDIQMKYDIAKNEDGPLRRTINLKNKPDPGPSSRSMAKVELDGEDKVTSDRYPGLDERVRNIEAHLAVRYVPSPPRSLVTRLKFLEDHIIKLEKEYPPWAALHFNQPNRGWPPPPRQTPIVVPSHLTSSEEIPAPDSNWAEIGAQKAPSVDQTKGRKKSSLHRAVMEKLEVQKAMNDLSR